MTARVSERYAVGDKVTVCGRGGGYAGEVVVVVPRRCNPLIEIRRGKVGGGVSRIEFRCVRDEESYIVKPEGADRLMWPEVRRMARL